MCLQVSKTVLMHAAVGGYASAVKLIVNTGADLAAQDKVRTA